MESYHSYKDSGVGWIGVIPSKWDLKRVGSVFEERRETVSDKDFPPLSVSKRGVVPQLAGVAKTDNNDNRKLVRNGDFVINSRSDRKGSSGLSNLDGSVSVINIVLKPTNIFPQYSHYLFKSYLFIEEFFRNGKGIVMDLWSTRFSELKYILIPLPPLPEQHQIVSFLDTKTSIIDSLIEKTQIKIELLKEQRTSLINEVVTKGLNPDVEMKDSGVEWIGEIPSHWMITKVKYVTNQVSDGSHFTPTYVDEGVPFLRVTDIHSKYIELDNVKYITKEEHRDLSKRCNPNKGDLLLSKNGTIGITKVIDWDWEFSIFVSLCLIKFKENFSPYLFSYFFQSDIVDVQISESSKKSTVTNLHLDKIRELLLVNPPISEQQQIVEYLDFETQLIDRTISNEEKRIELLKEYRQSLISEVVTGKVKVPGV